MPPKFGTSGLRGLVEDLGPDLIGAYIGAFIAACPVGGTLCLGRDLRPSSLRIAADVAHTARRAGLRVIDCGALPTPALAMAARDRGAGAVMVTGSHIPADRNGLKFYTPAGEISKADEAAITRVLGTPAPARPGGAVEADPQAANRFKARYLTAFGPAALQGRRIGLYAHSAVGRDLLAQTLQALGAEIVELGRSADFIPVDTEAVEPQTQEQIEAWCAQHQLDALVSTDGDSDRPILADETGRIVPGDILGQITAQSLGATTVVTPISSNSGVMMKGFAQVIRTRIGSPFVIKAMEQAGGRVAGYEANGGFLLGFDAEGPAGPLSALVTRDSFLPLIMPLVAAAGGPLSARILREPPRTSLADRLQDVPDGRAQALVARLASDPVARARLLAELDETETALDLTDGLRLTLEGGRILHIRPSGNAPELRLYVETATGQEARILLARGLDLLGRHL